MMVLLSFFRVNDLIYVQVFPSCLWYVLLYACADFPLHTTSLTFLKPVTDFLGTNYYITTQC